MPAEVKRSIQLEIAHVLFTDIVGYSKLPINEQRALVERLNEIVRSTDEFQAAEAVGRLIKIPTGDGITLVFYQSPEAPVECALEMSRALKKHPALQLRMGIHSGPVSGVIDVTGKANVAGGGINTAQRVMDCGDAGHILLSKRVAEDLEQYPHWQPYLHELGECEVKHGVRISVVNLYTEELGNQAVPEKLKATRVAEAARRKRAAVRWLLFGALTLLVVFTAIGFGFSRYKRPFMSAPEKSIAVLPFENLSEDKANAYFADGIQEEILTRLSKIADLKVISRTSTQHYKSAPQNLPEIAKLLGVAHILEGSVQKSGESVRVNVQLIKAANDSHLWADTFDRKLTDIFSVESEVAKAIADQLRAKLTGQEERVLAAKPTDNPKAYDAYLLGRFELNKFSESGFNRAVEHFKHAIAMDPSFALAHAGLAEAYSLLGYWNYLPPKESFPEAKQAALQALKLDPDLAEAHGALAYTEFQYEWKFSEAEMEFKEAIRLNLHSASTRLRYAEYLIDFQRLQEGHEQLERARELDPLSIQVSLFFGGESFFARDFDRALERAQKTISMDPDNSISYSAFGQLLWKMNKPTEAFNAFQKSLTLDGVLSQEEIGELRKAYDALGLSGYKRKQGELMEKHLAQGQYQSAYMIALTYATAGADNRKALDWLETAVEERSPWLPELKGDPTWDDLRSQPRFLAVLKKIGLEK